MRWSPEALLAAPMLGAVHDAIRRLASSAFPDAAQLTALARAQNLRAKSGAAIHFVDPFPPPRTPRESYEMRILHDGTVATRPGNWHDLFNALVWLAFPRTKACLNGLHCEEIGRRGPDAPRGPVRDFLTLFDEGGAFVASADPSLSALLRDHAWKTLFVTHREAVRQSMRFVVFGHAVMEKVLAPYEGITARALVVDVPDARSEVDAGHAHLDAAGEEALTSFARNGERGAFGALPVLGVPGWCAANESPAYYDDTRQFRPKRR